MNSYDKLFIAGYDDSQIKEFAIKNRDSLIGKMGEESFVKEFTPSANYSQTDDPEKNRQIAIAYNAIDKLSDIEKAGFLFSRKAYNLFGASEWLARHTDIFDMKIGDVKVPDEVVYPAADMYYSQLSWKDPVKYGAVVGNAIRTATEFAVMPELTALKTQRVLRTALQFGIQSGVQLPDEEQEKLNLTRFAGQRLWDMTKAGLTGVAVGVAGKYFPNEARMSAFGGEFSAGWVRAGTLMGGFGALTAVEGGDTDDVIESMLTVGGFELSGALSQKIRKSKFAESPSSRSAAKLQFGSAWYRETGEADVPQAMKPKVLDVRSPEYLQAEIEKLKGDSKILKDDNKLNLLDSLQRELAVSKTFENDVKNSRAIFENPDMTMKDTSVYDPAVAQVVDTLTSLNMAVDFAESKGVILTEAEADKLLKKSSSEQTFVEKINWLAGEKLKRTEAELDSRQADKDDIHSLLSENSEGVFETFEEAEKSPKKDKFNSLLTIESQAAMVEAKTLIPGFYRITRLMNSLANNAQKRVNSLFEKHFKFTDLYRAIDSLTPEQNKWAFIYKMGPPDEPLSDNPKVREAYEQKLSLYEEAEMNLTPETKQIVEKLDAIDTEAGGAIARIRWKILRDLDNKFLNDSIDKLKKEKDPKKREALSAEMLEQFIKDTHSYNAEFIQKDLDGKVDYQATYRNISNWIAEGNAALAQGKDLFYQWGNTTQFGKRRHYTPTKKVKTIEDDLIAKLENATFGDFPVNMDKKSESLGDSITDTERQTTSAKNKRGDAELLFDKNIINAFYEHYRKINVIADNMFIIDDFGKLIKDNKGIFSENDTALIRSHLRNNLAKGEDVSPILKKIQRASSKFWPFWLGLDTGRSAVYFSRQMFQTLSHFPSVVSPTEAAKSVYNLATNKESFGSVMKKYREIFDSEVSQRSETLRMIALTDANTLIDYNKTDYGRIGAKIGFVMDKVAQIVAGTPDSLTRAASSMHAIEAAQRNLKLYDEGKITARELSKNLSIDQMLPIIKNELYQLIRDKNYEDFTTRYTTEKVSDAFGRYFTNQRSYAEQSMYGKMITGIINYPRIAWEIALQQGFKPIIEAEKTGNYERAYAGAKTLLKLTLGHAIAGQAFYQLFGKSSTGIASALFGYSPLAPGFSILTESMQKIGQAVSSRESKGELLSMDMLEDIAKVPVNQLLFMIPMAETMINIYEAKEDKKGVQAWSLIARAGMSEWQKKKKYPFKDAHRDSYETIMHALAGGFETGKAEEIRQQKAKKRKDHLLGLE